MLRGIYTAACGMDLQQAVLDKVSTNLANSATPGYKKQKLVAESFPEHLVLCTGGRRPGGAEAAIGTFGPGCRVAQVVTSFEPGYVRQTGRAYDLCLDGPGFLTVEAPTGDDPARVAYTRNGSLRVDAEGYLVTADGRRLLGEGGPIQVGGADFKISPQGQVEIGGQAAGRLLLAEFDRPQDLIREEGGLYADVNGQAREATATRVRQGFLETANVEPVEEIKDLLAAVRAYEAGQRLIQAHDELLEKAVNQLGSTK